MLNKYADLIEIKKSNYGHTKYTIAIPTFKRSETLANTLKSACDQEYDDDYKIIVVDNNPERDDETEIFMNGIEDSRVSYYKNSNNVGMINNWNQCILVANSDWVVLVHDDDLLTMSCLNNIDETIAKYPKVDAVLPNFVQKDNPYHTGSPTPKKGRTRKLIGAIVHCIVKRNRPITANLFCDNIYGPPTCGLALRKDAVVEFGGYSERCIAADWDFMSHFSRNHIIAKNEKMTGIYLWAVNASMKESTMEQMRKDRIIILKDIIEYSAMSKFYFIFLRKDFDKKFKTNIMEHVDYSVLYRMIRKYYGLRV